ncbi:LamG-like jellyroll fold domain-containing protein [Kytococcus sp. Marseille-QA3725]
MCRENSCAPGDTPSRRAVILGSGTAGLTGVLSGLGSGPAHAADATDTPADAETVTSRPVGGQCAGDRQFTLAVMPDTQYLFDDDSIHPEPLTASLKYLQRERRRQDIAFLAHLGDLTENGLRHEVEAFDRAWDRLRHTGIPFSLLAGNHDVGNDTTDDRGQTPYLDAFERSTSDPGVLSVSPDGYSTAHTFTAAGREWMVLALDWRLSESGLAWADRVLTRHRIPTILTTHELVHADAGDGAAQLSPYGAQLWDRLVRRHDHVFLTLNGHFWPSGRTTLTNDAGHETHLHLANYQQRYYGGAAMMRLYLFDLERGVIDVETLAPWVSERDPERRNEQMAEELVVTGELDRFTVEIDFDERFADFAPAPEMPEQSPAQVLVRDTVAYWRWDDQRGATLLPGQQVRDLSGRGNHLEVVAGGHAIEVTEDHHPEQPGHASIALGGPEKASGDHLRTVAAAPLNTETFERGYTVEAFFRMPEQWTDRDAWTALLSREGAAERAGKTGGDAEEPVVTLSLSGERQLQWVAYPTSLDTSLTNWGHELRLGRWWHVAVVNDHRHTTMYVEGCPVVRNPLTRNRGLTTLDERWLLGAYTWDGAIDAITRCSLGDVRIAARALDPEEFMTRC